MPRPQLMLRISPSILSRLHRLAAVRGCTAQEIIRAYVARGLEQDALERDLQREARQVEGG